MKTFSFLAFALAAGTLAAQAPTNPLDRRVMLFGDYTRPEQFTLAQSTTSDVKDRADSQLGFGIRFMGELPGTLNWYYEFGGRLESSSKLKVNGPVSSALILDSRDVAIKYSYWMIGIGYEKELGSVVNLGFHLDGRGEALGAKGEFFDGNRNSLGMVNQSTSYFRPWARLSLTFNFKAGDVRSFVGLEGAIAILKTSQERVESTYISERTLKSMAPKFNGGIYAGIRF